MSITIIKAGMLDSVQDEGRYGYREFGINPSGVMDRYAMHIANALVGNKPGEAVIELHFPAAAFLFSAPALVAIAGADFSATINGEAVPHLHPLLVVKNDVLQFHKPIQGARACLAVKGGLAIDEWLGSRSTNLKAVAGGYKGRTLQKNDELYFREAWPHTNPGSYQVLPWRADTDPDEQEEDILVVPGAEWNRLTPASQESFTNTSFEITRQSDRMGYRLNNIPLHLLTNEEVVSSAVGFGTIQLLPGGKLIILMADHQTTGGYPRAAHVITAHHSKLAQLHPGNKARFRFTSQEKAEELYMKQQQHLLQLQNACTFRLEEYLHVAGN